MRKEILEALTAKFEGVSASILGRIADKLAKTATTPEQVKTAVEGMTLQQVIESYGDSRATEASNTARENAVKDYESRYGLKDGAKTAASNAGGAAATATGDNGNGGESEPPAWAKAMMERLDRMETAKTAESRRQQLDAVTSKLPEPLRKAYARIPLDNCKDEEFSSMLAEITTEVEGIAADTAARGGVFGKPTAATGAAKTDELTKEQLDAIAHREGVPGKDGQPF